MNRIALNLRGKDLLIVIYAALWLTKMLIDWHMGLPTTLPDILPGLLH